MRKYSSNVQVHIQVVQSATSKEDCFLRQPEWRTLLTTSTTWPSNVTTTEELRSLKLRIELCQHLFELPSILKQVSSLHNDSAGSLAGFDAGLLDQALRMCSSMKQWLHHEVEPHIFSYSLDTTGATIEYSDMIAGVVDCVANTTLLTLDKIICLLYHGSMPAHAIDTFDGPKTVEGWYRRALTAFEFVQSESTIAAKPLGIGLQQFQSSGPKPLELV